MILRGLLPWLIALCILLPKAYLQMPMQVFQMPPMFAVPPPPAPVAIPPLPAMSFQIALPMPIPIEKTTTTTERSIGIAVPIQLPFPVQVAIPAQPPPSFCNKRSRPYNCPVCPPCMCNPCTPAFFSYCSSCHQKCRCRDKNDVPEPLPHVAPVAVAGPAFPMAVPNPLIGPSQYLVPFHKKQSLRDESSENVEDLSLESGDFIRRHRHSRKREKRKYSSRRNFFNPNRVRKDEDFFKPVLSYLTRDGSVKLEQPLSDDEAEELLDESKPNQRVYVTAGQDSEYRPRLQVISHAENGSKDAAVLSNHRRKRVYLKSGSINHVLAEGKKELVFNPPVDKKITNLSVSFQIT